MDSPFLDPSVKVPLRWPFPRNFVFEFLSSTLVVTSTYMDASLQGFHWMVHLSFCQRILKIVSGNIIVCALFLLQESFQSWDMFHSFDTCLPFFYKNKPVLPPTHVPGA